MMPNRSDAPSLYMGTFLAELRAQFPRFVFTGGLNSKGRYAIFIYNKVERGTSFPTGPEIALFETEGSSEEAINVLCTKIAMIHG